MFSINFRVVLILIFVAGSASLNTVFAQPGNNTVATATSLIPVTICGATSGTLGSCTSDGISSTCSVTTNDVWYYFTVPAGISAIILSVTETNVFPSGTAYLEVYNASTPASVTSGNSRICGTSASGLNLTGLTPGATYYFRLFSSGNVNSSPQNKWQFTICASYVTPPTNDDCAGATSLTIGSSASGTVWLATASSGIPVDCATGNPDDDVWYSFTATASSMAITLSSIGTDLTTSGARMQLFSGSCAALSSVACGTTTISYASLSVSSVYYVRVYSAGTGALASSGGSVFNITASITPGNDECSSAYLIPTSSSCLNAEGTVVGATQSSGIPVGCATGTPDDDVWYKFVAGKSSPTITLSSIGTNLSSSGSRLQLLSGACGALTSLSCGTTSIAASGLVTGNTYYLRVYSNGATPIATNGSFNLCIIDPSPDLIADSTTTLFTVDTVARQLGYPWEVTYGPDDSLWITEARGYRVLRISGTRTGTQKNVAPQQILKIPLGGTEVTFGRSIGTWPQGGMEGLAIHPDFMTNPAKRWVYIAYVYSGTCAASPATPCYFRSKIVRCQFYFAADAGNPTSIPKRDTLVILDTVISNLPGSNDHNSGRLKIDPVMEGGTYKMYYTIGDMGAGQFNNASRPNNAQFKDTCEGKILRLNTEPDGDASYPGVTHDFNTWRQWIPNDNPFTHSKYPSMPTPIFTYGHRNAQGLSWGQVNGTWRLYSSEHGDHSDDEVNILESGKNYGWPLVAGVADNNYTTGDDVSDGFTYNNVLAGQTVVNETTWANAQLNYKNPIFDFFNWNPAQIEPSNTGNIFNWPTIAPSGIEFYGGNIPGWKNSLLVTSLKYGIFRLKLNANGDAIDSTVSTVIVDTIPLLHGWRVRDAAINPSPTSGIFWVVIDSSGSTSGPTGGFGGANIATKDGGKVLKLTYKTLITLAVDFVSFKGKLLPNQTIGLVWDANADINHDYFDVQKKLNGTWTTIGRVTGGPPYNFIDIHPLEGDNLYRISAVENTGKMNYSSIVNVKYQPSNYIVSIYPNPVHNFINLRINSPKPAKLQVNVVDMQGKIVYKSVQTMTGGLMQVNIPVTGWPMQAYLVELIDQNGAVIYTEKVLKN